VVLDLLLRKINRGLGDPSLDTCIVLHIYGVVDEGRGHH